MAFNAIRDYYSRYNITLQNEQALQQKYADSDVTLAELLYDPELRKQVYVNLHDFDDADKLSVP